MVSLEQLYTVNGILLDKNGDGIAEGLRGFIYLPENCDSQLGATAIEIAARIGYECVALDYPLTKVYDSTSPPDLPGSVILQQAKDKEGDGEITLHGQSYITATACTSQGWKSIRYWLAGLCPDIFTNISLQDLRAAIEQQYTGAAYITSLKIDTSTNKICSLGITCESDEQIPERIVLPLHINQLMINDTIVLVEHCNQSENLSIANTVDGSSNLDAQHPSVDLGNLFLQPALLSKNNELPETFASNNFTFIISSAASIPEITTAAHLAARCGLEKTEFYWPLVYLHNDNIPNLHIPIEIRSEKDASKSAVLSHDFATNKITLSGSDTSLLLAAEGFFAKYPLVGKTHTIQDFTIWLTDLLKGENPAGEVLRVEQLLNKTSSVAEKAYLSLGPVDQRIRDFRQILNQFQKLAVHSKREPHEVLSWNYQPEWEVDIVSAILNKKLYPEIKAEDKVEVKIILSEEQNIRQQLENEISLKIVERGGSPIFCKVYRAYKQGICWLLETVVPHLVETGISSRVNKVRIGFRPFLAPDQCQWQDEAGATPTLNPERNDDPDKYFDLPTRLLQELYPIDDLLALELPITRNDVEFHPMVDSDFDYLIEFLNKDNQIIYRDSLQIKLSERPYLDMWPTIGKVHPNTGWIYATINDEVVIDERVKTDLENLWDYYQQQILPDVKEYVLRQCDGNLRSDLQPFFSELRIQITASEPDYQLPTRKDLISTLDGLHEDIYFIGLDFFRTLGLRHGGASLGEPGLIQPIIRKAPGQAPILLATLYAEQHATAGVLIDNEYLPLSKHDDISLQLQQIEFNQDGLNLSYQLSGNTAIVEELLDAWLKLEQNALSLIPTFLTERVNWLRISSTVDSFSEKHWNFPITKQNAQKREISITEIILPTDEVIGTEQNEQLITELSHISELQIYEVAKSYQGRSIYAIEVMPDLNADVISRTKLINSRPGFMLNHRHHANEVSATNSAYQMLRDLLTKKEYAKYRQLLNLVVVPFENVDGGAIHYRLMQDNPEWKLHVARYNSVGKEIANDYFNPRSRYGECFALPRLYYRWLPDAFVDNHGVPSHEWDQQFAGYVSPWFKGFWLPRALFYGYFWYADVPEFENHYLITKALAAEVAKQINYNEEITAWNLDWQERFDKYAHQWLPKLFPAEYLDNLIYYWIPYKPSEKARHFAPRFPQYTVIDWTTEVSDETAQGEYLALCSRALTISDFATMELLINLPITFNKNLRVNSDKVYRSKKRKRPILSN